MADLATLVGVRYVQRALRATMGNTMSKKLMTSAKVSATGHPTLCEGL